MLLAYIYRSITHRVHFLDKASRDLFICAKDLFVAAKEETPATRGYVAGRGKLKQSRLRVEFGLFRSARHRAERFSSGVVAVRETCSFAPKTCSLKPWRPTHMGRCLQDQHSKAVARRLTAMPEVLPVQFMQMLRSNGVKLLRDLAVADECNSNHEQCCANDPQSE